MLRLVTAIFDNGFGSNLIRENVLPTPWLANVKPIRVSVISIDDTAFIVECVIRLLVEINMHKTKEAFEVAPKLATKMFFATAFTNREIDGAETKCRQIIPKSGRTVAVVSSFEDQDAVQFTAIIATKPVGMRMSNPAVCRVAKARTVLQSSKAPVLVQTGETESYNIEATSMRSDEKRLKF